MSIVADPVDAFVGEAIQIALETVDLSGSGDFPADPWAIEVERHQEELNGIARERAEGLISRSEWEAMREVISRKIDEARARVTSPRRAPVPLEPGTSGEVWPNLSLMGKQAVFDALLERVVVHPAATRGRGFRAERLELKWIA